LVASPSGIGPTSNEVSYEFGSASQAVKWTSGETTGRMTNNYSPTCFTNQ
jgi:hypothetical protein